MVGKGKRYSTRFEGIKLVVKTFQNGKQQQVGVKRRACGSKLVDCRVPYWCKQMCPPTPTPHITLPPLLAQLTG